MAWTTNHGVAINKGKGKPSRAIRMYAGASRFIVRRRINPSSVTAVTTTLSMAGRLKEALEAVICADVTTHFPNMVNGVDLISGTQVMEDENGVWDLDD